MKWATIDLARLKWLPVGWLKLILGQWRLVTSALVAGGVIHILVTLSAAQFTEATSYKRLTRNLPVNQPFFAPRVTVQSQPLAFFSANAFYSYCRFDASSTRIRVEATLPDAGWSLSLHTPRGENFYYVGGSNQRATNVKLMLEPPGNVFAHGRTEISDTLQSLPVVKLPSRRGLAILRAPIKGHAYLRQADELRAQFNCGVEQATRAF